MSKLTTICSRINRAAASYRKTILGDPKEEEVLIVAPAPSWNHHGKSLDQVLEHHAARDFGPSEGQTNPEWCASAFLVVTEEDWETKGLVLVIAEFEKGQEAKILAGMAPAEKLGEVLWGFRLGEDADQVIRYVMDDEDYVPW